MPKVTRIEFANEPEKQKKRVAVYCRVSSGSADQLNSLANQEKYYTLYVKRHPDWTLVDVFADEAITGTRADIRPEFQRMIRMCELKQIDMIITKSMARFARNTKDSLEYTKKLKLLGVAVIFEKEGINTLSVGDEMLINTFAAIAEEESMSISQNLRLANKKRMESGEYVCSNAPYGYRLINKQLVIEPTEAGVVREIYELYLSGLSADDIADKLTGDNIKPAIGKRWSRTSVAYILSNEKYIGDSLYQKKYGLPTVPFTKKYNKGEVDQYYAEGTHEGIIEPDVFTRVQELMSSRGGSHNKGGDRAAYTLTGKIKCAECGSTYKRKLCKGNVSWVCALHAKGKELCDSNYVDEDYIYKAFMNMVNKLRFGSVPVLKNAEHLLDSAAMKGKRVNQSASILSENISALNSKLLMLEQLRTKGYLQPEVYQAQANAIRVALQKKKDERVRAMDSAYGAAMEAIRNTIHQLEKLDEPIENFDAELFENIVDTVTIDKSDNVTFTLKRGLRFTERM